MMPLAVSWSGEAPGACLAVSALMAPSSMSQARPAHCRSSAWCPASDRMQCRCLPRDLRGSPRIKADDGGCRVHTPAPSAAISASVRSALSGQIAAVPWASATRIVVHGLGSRSGLVPLWTQRPERSARCARFAGCRWRCFGSVAHRLVPHQETPDFGVAEIPAARVGCFGRGYVAPLRSPRATIRNAGSALHHRSSVCLPPPQHHAQH